MGYLGPYLPKQISTSPLAIIPLGLARISISRQSLLASAIILLFALIHLLGLGPASLSSERWRPSSSVRSRSS